MIFLFQRISTHYRLPIFEKLNSKLDGDLIFAYGQSPKSAYFNSALDQKRSFRTVQLKNIWVGGERAVWQNFWQAFKQYGTPEVVISEHGPRIVSSYFLFIYCKIKKIPLILWGHGGSRERSVSKSHKLKDKIHRCLIKNCDAYICYTDTIKHELSSFADVKKLFVARNTLDTETLFSIRNELEKRGKDEIKKELNLKKGQYICFIGRLFKEKRVDLLIDVFELIHKQNPDTGLIIIGDGPERSSLENKTLQKGLDGLVLFTGEISDWHKSGQYLYISDLMVNPGFVGLSVNHVFCFGIPVVTQASSAEGPFHSPEIEYVKDGETGFICKPNDIEDMADQSCLILAHPEKYKKRIDEYCRTHLKIENMIEGFTDAIEYIKR